MSTSKDEPRYHHGDLRRALVAGGLVLLEEKGASALGLREIARLVGVSAAAPYRHFADRKALLEAVAAEGFRGFAAAMAKAAEGLPEAEQLAAMAFAYVRFALDAAGAVPADVLVGPRIPIAIRSCASRPTQPMPP